MYISKVEHKYDHDMDALIHDAFPMHTNCDNDDDAYTNIKDWDSEAFTKTNIMFNNLKRVIIQISSLSY
jgi:competence transcription factor ComK